MFNGLSVGGRHVQTLSGYQTVLKKPQVKIKKINK